MKLVSLSLALMISSLFSSSALLYGQNLSSMLILEGGNYKETLKDAEKQLWYLMKKTDFRKLKAHRFSISKPAETMFTMKFDQKKSGQTLGVYYFIPKKHLSDRPEVEILDCKGNSASLKKRIFIQDGLIVYDVFLLELPVDFSEDNVRFKASTPGKLLAFLN